MTVNRSPSTLKVRSGLGVDGKQDAEHVKGVLGLVVGLDGQQVAEHDEGALWVPYVLTVNRSPSTLKVRSGCRMC